MRTTNGKRGGNLVGKPHNDKSGTPVGGIKAQVTDAGGKPVELEGGEVIINKEASKKYWKELSKINQSAGNGVPIEKPIDPHDEDPSEYEEGGKIIEFNRNHLPNKWILSYAKSIKKDHPEIWKLGGNIYGNTAFENLSRVAERGYWLDSEEWMYKKWQSFLARHQHDFRIAGVVAVLKWGGKVNKGWAYMKNLIEDKIKKGSTKPKSMKDGGSVEDENIVSVSKYILSRHPKKGDTFKGGKVDGFKIARIVKETKNNAIIFKLYLIDSEDKKRVVMYQPKTNKIGDFQKSFLTASKGTYYTTWSDTDKMKDGGELIKRADGSYSQRGLWDNIRDNAGSGKKPTKQMLEQEAKIKADSMRDGGAVNNLKFKIGSSYYYKNQYMDDSIKLILIGKEEWEDSLNFKKPNGSQITLKKYELKYLSKQPFKIDGYSFEKQFSSFIAKEISESPKQIFGVIKSIDKNEYKGESTITFTEEIKDGRTRKFDISSPLKLKGKSFTFKGITLNVKSIKFIDENKQESDYNEYVDSNYLMNYAIEYTDKMADGGSVKTDCIEFIKKSESLLNNGFYLHIKNLNVYVGEGDKTIPNVKSLILITYNSGGQSNSLSQEIANLIGGNINVAKIILSEQIAHSKRISLNVLKGFENENIIIADRDRIVCTNLTANYEDGGSVDWENIKLKEDFDWDSLFEQSNTNYEPEMSVEQEREEGYQKSDYSKRWAATYKEAVEKTLKEYLDAKASFEDWSSRKYKSNKGVVYTGGDDIFGEAKTIGSINDSRRNNTIKGLKMVMDESIETLKNLGLSDEEITNLTETKSFEDGGEVDDNKFNPVIIYHEKNGNWLIPKNNIYAWLYDVGDASEKLNSQEFDMVFFGAANISMAFQKGFVPPLLRVWSPKYQKETKGSKHLMGIVQAWYDEDKKKLYVMMMTTNPKHRRKGINGHIVKAIREGLELTKDDVIFDKPTDMGKSFMKSGKFEDGGEVSSSEYLNVLQKVGITEEERENWRESHKVNQRQVRNDKVKEAAEKLKNGSIPQSEYLKIVAKEQPIKLFTQVPKLPTAKEIVSALNKLAVSKGIIGYTKHIEDGTKVASRLDIPAYENYDTWVVSVHDGIKEGLIIAYGQTAYLKDVEFKTFPKTALDIATGKEKTTIGRMFGNWENKSPNDVRKMAVKYMNDPNWVQVGMNPFRHSWFYDKKDGMPLVSSSEVIQVGALVLAKNPVKTTPDNDMFIADKKNPSIKFADGGEVKDEFANTKKLIDEIKKHSFYTKGTISTAKDGSKYRYDSYKLKYPNSANWLVQLFEKASEENTGKSYHTQFNHTDKYSFSYDRARFKGMPHGRMGFKELVLI